MLVVADAIEFVAQPRHAIAGTDRPITERSVALPGWANAVAVVVRRSVPAGSANAASTPLTVAVRSAVTLNGV